MGRSGEVLGRLWDGQGRVSESLREDLERYATQDGHLDAQMPPRMSTWTSKRGHGAQLGGPNAPPEVILEAQWSQPGTKMKQK